MSTGLFGRASDYARGVLSELTDDDLRRPTPCEGWDAGRVVRHLADVLALVSPALDVDARGESFAAPIDVPGNASASDRLVAFLGRVPRH